MLCGMHGDLSAYPSAVLAVSGPLRQWEKGRPTWRPIPTALQPQTHQRHQVAEVEGAVASAEVNAVVPHAPHRHPLHVCLREGGTVVGTQPVPAARPARSCMAARNAAAHRCNAAGCGSLPHLDRVMLLALPLLPRALEVLRPLQASKPRVGATLRSCGAHLRNAKQKAGGASERQRRRLTPDQAESAIS